MRNKIHLNKDTTIDIPKLMESRAVILANSGGGKSYAIRKIAENAVDQVQTIILDPEGEFASLREKYDFILAGKAADVPVETRSASLLAIKLLELGKSAVIDLYELHPQERQRYVKIFCDALVNCPKELYHSVLIILDEAHEYAPEGKPSEATWAVEALASKGRKRGFCLVPASQRIAKLSKNLSAECNNKLIGRASQDIDMKRAGDELGFSKDKLVQLRQLKPGEFFAFGPAISDEVIKVKIGEVKTTHAKVGYKHSAKVPPPSHVIKKVLRELIDLPQEAEKEAKTIQEYKSQVSKLKRELVDVGRKKPTNSPDPKAIERAIKETERKMNIEFMAERDEFLKHINTMFKVITEVGKVVKDIKMPDFKKRKIETQKYKEIFQPLPKDIRPIQSIEITPTMEQVSKGEIKILTAIAQYPEGVTNEHIAVLTGYKSTSRSEYLRKLKASGLVHQVGDNYLATPAGVDALGPSFEPLPTGDALREHIMRTLPGGEKKILSVIIEAYPNPVSHTEIEDATGYKATSRSEYVRKLKARKLVETNGGMVVASEKLYD